MDYMINEDKATNKYFGTDMYDNKYLFDYIDSFYLSDDNLENNDLIYNANAIKKEFKIYSNIYKKSHIYKAYYSKELMMEIIFIYNQLQLIYHY